MADPQQLTQDFLNALRSNDTACYEAILSEEVGMRLNRWDGREIYQPRQRVVQRFIDEWSSWPDPTLEGFDVLAHGDRVAVEFRIQATEFTILGRHVACVLHLEGEGHIAARLRH